jgi:hypothetical protein
MASLSYLEVVVNQECKSFMEWKRENELNNNKKYPSDKSARLKR